MRIRQHTKSVIQLPDGNGPVVIGEVSNVLDANKNTYEFIKSCLTDGHKWTVAEIKRTLSQSIRITELVGNSSAHFVICWELER